MDKSITLPALVLLCYARSGGTLFSRCVASLPNVVLTSEVNPVLNAKGDIATQLNMWYDFELKTGPFAEMATEALKMCNDVGKRLVIRDFSFIDFTPHQLNRFAPSYDFSVLKNLEKSMSVQTVAFVRNAYDVWISRGCPPNFGPHYLRYVQALKEQNIPVFKFEDFTANPSQILYAFCRQNNISFNEEALSNAFKHNRITGDVDLKKPSRGSQFSAIKPLKRKRLPRFLAKKAQADLQLTEANRLLGYPTKFHDSVFENEPSFTSLEIKWFFKRFFLKYPTDLY